VIILTIEKIIQHVVVTLCFYYDFGGLRSVVSADYRLFMISGGIVGVLFLVALWGLWNEKGWSIPLVAGLALFDIVGEFIAQSELFIVVTVSFIVAVVLLILCYKILGNSRELLIA
jgi:hypothetical protein